VISRQFLPGGSVNSRPPDYAHRGAHTPERAVEFLATMGHFAAQLWLLRREARRVEPELVRVRRALGDLIVEHGIEWAQVQIDMDLQGAEIL